MNETIEYNMTPRELLKSGAAEMHIELDDAQLDKFEAFTALLLEWNQKFNITRIVDPHEIVIRHYLDSLSLLNFVKIPTGSRLIDIGTGGGMPGIPLKIAVPDLQLTLLDSVKKKLTFAEVAAAELGLSDVETLHARAEDAGQDRKYRERYHFAVSRAVARLNLLAELCIPFCKIGGKFIAYKGPEGEAEIELARKALKSLEGEVVKVHKFTLPHSDAERTLIVIKKVQRTHPMFPRKPGIPAKNPL